MRRLALFALPCVLVLACAKPESTQSREDVARPEPAPTDAVSATELSESDDKQAEKSKGPLADDAIEEEAADGDAMGGAEAKPTNMAPAPGGDGPMPMPEGGDGGLDVRVPMINGGLHRDIIRRTAGTHEADIRGCVPPALAANPGLADILTLELEYEDDGKVSAAKVPDSSLFTLDAVEDCVQKLAEGWSFPAPDDGKGGALTLEIRLQ